MIQKKRQRILLGLKISLIVNLSMLVWPAYAADLQEAEDDIADIDIVMTDQGEPAEENTDEETAGEGSIAALEDAVSGDVMTNQEEPAEEDADGDSAAEEIAAAPENADPEASPDEVEENDSKPVVCFALSTKIKTSEATEETEEETKEESPMPFVRPIKDGIYVIVSKINGFKAIQTEDGSKKSGKQIEVQNCDGSDTQKFKLTSDAKTGYYSITNVHSSKNLAVKGNNAKAGTSIVQNVVSASLGQKWILVKNGDYYMLQSALDGSPLALSLKRGSTENGADVVLDDVKDAASQLFSFLVSKPSVEINEGVYEISSALDKSMKLDIRGGSMKDNGNLQIYKSNGTAAQKFIIENAGSGRYTMTSYNSGKAIDLSNGSVSAKANAQQYTKNGTTAQKWLIRNVGDGTIYITSGKSWLPLEVKDSKTANKTNVYVNTATGQKAQKFYLTKVSEDKLKPIANGVYLLNSIKHNNRVVGVEDASRLQKANIQLQYNTNASFQKFKFTHVKNGYYKIQNVKSKHMIDICDGSMSNKANIQQYHDNGTKAQLWLPHKNSDGSYTFVNAKSSKVFDIAGGSTEDSTNIRVYHANNSASQKFKLTKTFGADSTAINNGAAKADSVLSAMCKKAQDYNSDINYLVLADVTNHRLVLFNKIEGRWISVLNSPISVGKASTPTPTGTFYVYNHYEYFDGDYKDSELTYQCWWSTCFYGSYYFHSVLYDYNSGYPGRLRDGRMCMNVSHGCVRMPLENAKYLYDHSPIGTKVRVYM